MSSNTLSVELIENKTYRETPYQSPRKSSLNSAQGTSSFTSEQISHLESIIPETTIKMNITTNDISELLQTLPYFEPNENLPVFIAKVEKVLETLRLFTLTAFQEVLITYK